jgi:hypothetical protein
VIFFYVVTAPARRARLDREIPCLRQHVDGLVRLLVGHFGRSHGSCFISETIGRLVGGLVA